MTGDVEVLHPASAALAAVSGALDELVATNLWSMPTGELAALVVGLERLGRRLDSVRVVALGQAQSSLVAEREGATSIAAWLKAVADVPVGVSKTRLALNQALAARPTAAAAFAAGDIGLDATAAVCAAIGGLPGAVPAALTAQIEELLVDVAREEGTRAVTVRAADIVHRFAPEQLERDEAVQAAKTRLKLSLRYDGTVGVRGVLDKEAGALALAVLGPLAAPAPATDGSPDFRDAETRYGQAFTRVLQLASASAPGVRGERPAVVVTIGLDSLRGEPGSAPGRLETGTPISAGAARRLACDATIVPLVLGSSSEPLDIGRASRLVPSGLRRALVARDQGCAMPGCDRPPGWCDAHHRKHWSAGGETSLRNLCLLCERHHTIVHADGWRIAMIDGLPWFTPPPWLDSAQTPRLNSRYKTRKLGP